MLEGNLLSCSSRQGKPMGWMIQGAIPDREHNYYSPKSLDTLWGHRTSYSFDTGGSFSEGKAARV
jgi:hypothetical protein